PGDASGRTLSHFSASRVWRTTNGGLTWTRIASATAPISPGLPSSRRFRSSSYNLGVSPTSANRIAIGAGGGFLDVTTDGGASWKDISLIAKAPGFLGFVTNVTWQDDQTLWVTSVSQTPGAVRVIKGSIANPGDSWATATFVAKQSGLPDLPVTRVYFDPRDASRNTIYAATHVGIYRTTDGGENWQPFGNGLPTVRVNDIYMPPDGGFMRIATYGRGIWELSQLELVSAQLADDSVSCDADGVLDNGETGRLRITLKNQGPNTVNHVTLVVTSNNPHVTFPRGNTLAFPPVQKNDVTTGAILVALNGASGIETADFHIEIQSPELGLPTPLTVISTHRLNYDEVTGSAVVESAESAHHSWSIAGGLTTAPNIGSWQRRALSPTEHVWWGPDNNGQNDGQRTDAPDEQTLVSPTMHVGAGPFVVSFRHRFSFEGGGWDGGVVEISTNGGSSWSDVGTTAYNGLTNGVTSAPIGANRAAFVNRMIGWPAFANVTLNLGATYANQDVQIRFRVGADESTGAPGWDIDDVTVTGISNTPFTGLLPQTSVCSAAH
ncbi:MAG: hypothetical protein ABI837_19990, partial [Acidobacteriota bacterium]